MINQSIAHYRINAKLGQGGMGEVYRATDTMLAREVAIKVLPQTFAADSARLARFDREAKVLASLNHPNIAVIYGIEQSVEAHALIMELVEGETLAERLQREPMTVPEALDCCRQIAEALEAAHEKGIIHRDLKPENVKIDEEGKVKVLDFGLAKALADPSLLIDEGVNQADSPTLTNLTTVPGQLLGTAPYMSPEQARSRPVDKRSDIWSFGCVLYECLTGKPIFQGEDVTETLASIIKGEPDWSALPEDTPPMIELLLRKCLTKDRKRRLRDIGDARIDIEQALGDPSSSIIRLGEGALRESQAGRGVPRLWVAGLVLAVAFIAVALTWFLKPASILAPPPARHAELVLPGPYRYAAESGNDSFALSPDGRRLIYSLADLGPGLRVLDLASGREDKPIPGTESMQEGHPFFSQNGSRFGCLLGDDLMTMPIRGGTPEPLGIGKFLNLSFHGSLGADWSKQGIVFVSPWEGLRLVSTDSGNPTKLTELKIGETQAFPQFLPGGRQILFVVSTWLGAGHPEVVDITTRQRKKLNIKGFEGCDYASYSPSGHLLYELGGDVFAVAFDPQRLETRGTPKLVLKGVAVDPGGRAQFDVARDGTLIYLPGEDLASRQRLKTLAWIDPNGQARPFTQEHGLWYGFNLSPDEKRVALTTINANIWILDKTQEGNEKLRVLVNDLFWEFSPHWSKDGEWIYFTSDREGKFSIWKKKADYSEAPAQLVWEAPFAAIGVQIVSGSDLIFDHFISIAPGGIDNGDNVSMELWRLPLNQENATPEPILKKPGVIYFNPALSPDGNWLAYTSTEEGGASRVYVRAMHGSTESEKVSDGPGQHPCWSKDGDQIFYQSGPDFYSAAVMAQDGRLVAKKAVKVLSFNGTIISSLWNSWTVAGENNRILAMVNADDVGLESKVDVKPASSTGPTHLEIIANWFTELNKEVPPAK